MQETGVQKSEQKNSIWESLMWVADKQEYMRLAWEKVQTLGKTTFIG
jgi:hypothetical protein